MARNNKTYKCILIKEKRVWNKAHDPPLNNLKLCWKVSTEETIKK